MIAWWTAQQAGWVGGIGGSVLGVCGGILGTAAGLMVPKGRGRLFIMTSSTLVFALALAALLAGLWALFSGQPYHVWYPLVLCGAIGTVVVGAQIPMLHIKYRQAELRRLDAETIRRG